MATVFFLAVMAGVGYYVFNRAVDGGHYVTIPNIVNLPVAEAYANLLSQGLVVGEQREMYNENVPKDHVIAQRPAPGKVVRTGRKVHPTVSVGPDLKEAPILIGQTLQQAQALVAQSGLFTLGPQPARMPHPSTPDLVIGQDPPPGRRIARGGQINLLVSSGGVSSRSITMRSIVGMPREEAERTMKGMGLTPAPVIINKPDAPLDIVIEQNPAAGALVRQGSEVRYKVRTTAQLPDAWREVSVVYTVPQSWFEQEVRIDYIGKDGTSWTLFPRPDDYEDGKPPKFASGTRITQPLQFKDQVTVEIYLDGKKAQSNYYLGDSPPVVSNFKDETEGNRGAKDQNSTVNPGF